MRNRQFQIRTVRRQIIADIAKGYYRPEMRPRLGTSDRNIHSGAAARASIGSNSQQLALDFAAPQPLEDIFPEAYDTAGEF